MSAVVAYTQKTWLPAGGPPWLSAAELNRIEQAVADLVAAVNAGGGGAPPDLTALTARVDALEVAPVLNTAATTYSLVAADAGRTIEFTAATAVTVTIPTNASTAFPVGARLRVRQIGAGSVSFAAASGVTLQVRNGATRMGGQFAEAFLCKRSANVWLLTGDVVPST